MKLNKLIPAIGIPILLFCSFTVAAQDRQLTGRITDAAGVVLSGVSVIVKGTNQGTSSASDGSFTITVPGNASTLVVSSVGYQTREISIQGQTSIEITLQASLGSMDEVVIVGYGTQRKRDLTGAVTAVSERDFNRGPITTPEQLIAGKVAGVQITSTSGAPGSGSRIRIRGGSSLNASNDPLIVIDGVPIDNPRNLDASSSVSGVANPLSLINPNDIESFNILKDASATAIYGSRASNGVILITTKKGTSGKLRVNFSTLNSISVPTEKVNVLSADEYRELVNTKGTEAQKALLGDENTDWQDEIYQTAFTTDNNISLSGGIQKLPYRLSLGFLHQSGILKTDQLKRGSATLNVNPKFLGNHLSVDLNLKASITNSEFADQGAIGAAVFFDPTQPVYEPANTELGGYFEWLDQNGNPNTLASRNPLSLLKQRDDEGEVKRSIGNIQIDYKFHFLPELRANLNLGYDVSNSDGTTIRPPTAASVFFDGGRIRHYEQSKENKLLEFYLNYASDIEKIKSRVDVTAGYTFQDWIREAPSFAEVNFDGEILTPADKNPFKTQNTLISFFGRANYSFDERYLLTATVRRDGSSRFSKDTRWGTFPSAAIAWRISQESFMRTSKTISDLKIRFGYGITGQQDIGGDYDYLARYSISDSSAMYQFGDMYYFTLRPQGYDANLKWEETETYNAGLDFGLFDGRISGSIDYYFKKTKDLLAIISVPAGSNLTNRILTNVGNIENKGIEFVLNGTPVQTKNFTWDANFNITYNESEVTNLSKVQNPTDVGIATGGISGGVGNTVQIHTIGHAPSSFYVYKQVYDQNGKPIEGLYANLNKDGAITEADKYHYKTPEPRVYLGFSSQFNYKNWNLSFTTRANFGNYMYNNFNSNNGTYLNFGYPNYLGNVSANVLETNFTGNDANRYWSDYYIENASFFRMDNLNLAYSFSRFNNDKIGLRLSATVQNVFVITEYTGLDPEIAGGIDNNFYPRPRVFSLGANLDF